MSNDFNEVFSQYEAFKKNVRNGQFGKLAQFWIQYMDRVWLLLQFSLATRKNDIDLHISSLQHLCPLLFSMNHHNYAKYLSVYFITLLNLPAEAKALLKDDGFSVSRSGKPAARTAVDLTIEQSINRHAKTSGGIVGFSRSLPAYYRWCVTRHSRALYVSAIHQMTNMDSRSNEIHKDLTNAQKKLSEGKVQKTMQAFSAFINPFDGGICDLVNLASGKKVTDEVATDILDIDQKGKASFNEFVELRLKTKKVEFYAPLTKSKSKTFSSVSKVVKVKTSKHEVKVKVQRNLFGQLLVLSQEHEIDMEKVLKYPLSPVPWSLAASDGLPLKTNKATLLHKLEKVEFVELEDASKVPNSVYIVDGNVLLHSLLDIPATFGDLAKKVFMCLPKAACIHFVTDTYKQESIKSAERLRRGSSENNTYLLNGSATKLPRNWKLFLSSEENKRSLINFLLTEWETDNYADKLENKEIFFVNEERCVLLTSEHGELNSVPVEGLFSSQEEADTRIILHCLYASRQPNTSRIIVRSTDTDVFLLLLSFSDAIRKPLFFDTGTGNNRRQINITKLASTLPICLRNSLLGLHALTGCDTTSCFAGKGKIKALKILQDDNDLIETLSRFGTSETIDKNDLLKLEAFVCKLYGKPLYESVDKVRFDKVRQSFKCSRSLLSSTNGIDLSQMPPCKTVLLLHIQRANFQTLIWRNASISNPELPKPENNGWTLGCAGDLEIKWFGDGFLPKELQDILLDDIYSEEEEDESESLTDSSGDEEDNETDDEM